MKQMRLEVRCCELDNFLQPQEHMCCSCWCSKRQTTTTNLSYNATKTPEMHIISYQQLEQNPIYKQQTYTSRPLTI